MRGFQNPSPASPESTKDARPPVLVGKPSLAVESGNPHHFAITERNEAVAVARTPKLLLTGVAGGPKRFVEAAWGLVGEQDNGTNPNEMRERKSSRPVQSEDRSWIDH